jgi:hypothetical protein
MVNDPDGNPMAGLTPRANLDVPKQEPKARAEVHRIEVGARYVMVLKGLENDSFQKIRDKLRTWWEGKESVFILGINGEGVDVVLQRVDVEQKRGTVQL